MTLIESISRKTTYTFAVGVFAQVFAGVVFVIGAVLGYFFMKGEHVELFYETFYIAAVINPVGVTFQLLLIGMIKPLTIKPLRPINENINGVNWSSDISLEQLTTALSALQKFPIINAVIGGIVATSICAILLANIYIKGYDPIIFFAGLVTFSVTASTFVFLIFFFTHRQITPLRQKGNSLSWQLRKRKQKMKPKRS